MPRIAITITLLADDGISILRESWSPLGYEDLGDPNLVIAPATPNGPRFSTSEQNLMVRLRTSIDRTLLTFSRRERRRWGQVQAADDTYDDPEFEHIGDIARTRPIASIPGPPPPHQVRADTPMVAPPREPKKKTRQAKRKSRYKRDPVI